MNNVLEMQEYNNSQKARHIKILEIMHYKQYVLNIINSDNGKGNLIYTQTIYNNKRLVEAIQGLLSCKLIATYTEQIDEYEYYTSFIKPPVGMSEDNTQRMVA
jgi:hypothetical protein